MARFTTTLAVPQSAEKTFAFVSAFDRTAEWDAGVAEAQKLTEGPVRLGTRFRVVAAFFGRRVEMIYTVTQLEAPHRIVLRGESSTVISEDEILVTPKLGDESEASILIWDARLTLKGLLWLGDPALHLAFQWIGRKAMLGLEQALGAQRVT
jgi:hypothetical protein